MTLLLELFGRLVIAKIEEVGRLSLFLFETARSAFTPPLRWRLLVRQMEFVGVRSVSVVVLTGTFTGMVLALQSSYGFRKFGAEGLVVRTVRGVFFTQMGARQQFSSTVRCGNRLKC